MQTFRLRSLFSVWSLWFCRDRILFSSARLATLSTISSLRSIFSFVPANNQSIKSSYNINILPFITSFNFFVKLANCSDLRVNASETLNASWWLNTMTLQYNYVVNPTCISLVHHTLSRIHHHPFGLFVIGNHSIVHYHLVLIPPFPTEHEIEQDLRPTEKEFNVLMSRKKIS